MVQDPPQVGGDGGIECRTVETKNYKDHNSIGNNRSCCIGKVLSLCFMNVDRLLFQYGVKKWLLILIITNTDREPGV